MKKYFKILLFVTILVCTFTKSEAKKYQYPVPFFDNSNFYTILYNPRAIHYYKGYYNVDSSIIFEEGEKILTISVGYSKGWSIKPKGSRLFIKPISTHKEDAKTNMFIITNKREYYFLLEAEEASIDDPEVAYKTKFLYSDSEGDITQELGVDNGPDLSDLSMYNFKYTYSGMDAAAPLKVFDDGEFTYFQFPNKNAELPAMFLVDEDGSESLVNYRIQGKYVVLERVAPRLTLRNGTHVVCIFNEKMANEVIKVIKVKEEDKGYFSFLKGIF